MRQTVIRKGLLKCSISVLLIFLFIEISAQQYNIRNFTTKEGLSHNDVRAIVLDSLGFLWLATWDGLSRFDGYSFKNYYHKSDDSLSLPYFSIIDINVDGGNNMWLMTDDQRAYMHDRDKDIFVPVTSMDNKLPAQFSSISIDESGNCWFVSTEQICRYDFRLRKFDIYDLFDRSGKQGKVLEDKNLFSVSTAQKGRIWLVSWSVYEFEISSGNKLMLNSEFSVRSNLQLGNHDFSYNYWFKIYFSGSGRKWITSNDGLFLFDDRAGEFREYRGSVPLNDFTGPGYFFWSRMDDGIFVLDPGEGKIKRLPHELCQLTKSIFCIDGNSFWFSNSSMTGASLGLNHVVFTPDYFKHYPLSSKKNDIPQVYAITKDNEDNLWVGTRGTDPIYITGKDGKSKKLIIPEFKTSHEPGAVRSLNAVKNGIWIGYFRDLLLFYDYKTGSLTRYNPPSDVFRPVAADRQGSLYLIGKGYDGRIISYSPEKKSIERILAEPTFKSTYKIYLDDNGYVWRCLNYCTVERIEISSGKSDTFILLSENYNIEDMCSGDNGDYWFAFLGGGVCRFNPSSEKKIFYRTSEGLANNLTYSIMKDNSGNIWVSTNAGISRINPGTGVIRTYGLNDGVNIIEFNSGASFKDDKGEFFMGGMGGVVSFFPDSINKAGTESVDQKIIVDDIRVSGQSKTFRRNIRLTDSVILNKGEDNFHVFFSSSDFINSPNTVYRYRLNGIDNNWNVTDSRNRSINYANLNPGWYVLELQATDGNGSWSPVKEITIEIKPYYYQTWLFRILVPLFLILLLSSVIFVYIRQIRQREAQKQNALRLQSLRGQMNPHFIFNSLNSINYFISNNDKLSANRYIADFSKLIRSILHNMNYDYITLDKEVESIVEYLKIEYLRFGDKFDYTISVNNDIHPEEIKVSPGLVQPFIENAIWHGVRGLENRKGNIVVKFGFTDGKLTCEIEDDGIGRKRAIEMKSKNDQKKSRGIEIVNERLRILNNLQNKNYTVIITDLHSDKPETGTRVLIELPFLQN